MIIEKEKVKEILMMILAALVIGLMMFSAGWFAKSKSSNNNEVKFIKPTEISNDLEDAKIEIEEAIKEINKQSELIDKLDGTITRSNEKIKNEIRVINISTPDKRDSLWAIEVANQDSI